MVFEGEVECRMTIHRAVQRKLDRHWLRLPSSALNTTSTLPPLLSELHIRTYTQQGNRPQGNNHNIKHGCKFILPAYHTSYSLRYALLVPHLQPLQPRHLNQDWNTQHVNQTEQQPGDSKADRQTDSMIQEQMTDSMTSSHRKWQLHKQHRRRRAVEVAEHRSNR
jgi:hypothetical protein